MRSLCLFKRGGGVVSCLIIKNFHPCFSMPTLKRATKIHQIQLEYLSLSGSAKSRYGTHRNFKTTRVRTRKKYFHLPIYLNPTCCSENLWLSSTPQRTTEKSTFCFLPPQKNKLQQLSALFIWRRVRRMYEAIFIKAGESFWTRPFPSVPSSHWSTAAAGSTSQVSRGCARSTVIYACDAFLDVLPAHVM